MNHYKRNAVSNHMSLYFSNNVGVLSYSPLESPLLIAIYNVYSYNDASVEFLKICIINLVVIISSIKEFNL